MIAMHAARLCRCGGHVMQARKLAANPDTFQLSLRIRHPAIDPAEISRELKVDPEHAFRAGDARPARSALTPATVHKESYWLGVLPPSLLRLDLGFQADERTRMMVHKGMQASLKGLTWALSLTAVRFLRAHAEFLKRIGSEGGEISLLVALSSPGEMSFTLPPQIGRFFADLGITLEFEISDE
jgi:hypothetical protein